MNLGGFIGVYSVLDIAFGFNPTTLSERSKLVHQFHQYRIFKPVSPFTKLIYWI